MKDIVDQLIDLAHAISLGHDEDGDEGVHRAAAAEITRLRALVTPQPIETAPKDGTFILLFGDGSHSESDDNLWYPGYYVDDERMSCWASTSGLTDSPTHWLPMPPAPVKVTM